MSEAGDSLAEVAYQKLLAAIEHLELRPGEPLAAEPLAKTLGISRTPVRDALLRMVQEGLVKQVPGRGLVVADLSLKDVQELIDLLELVESSACALAAERITPDQAEELRVITEHLQNACSAGDIESWRQVDREYHRIILDSADNNVFRRVITDTRRRLHRVSIGSVKARERLQECTTEHKLIAEAIMASDPERAADVTRLHMVKMRERMTQLVENVLIPLVGQRF